MSTPIVLTGVGAVSAFGCGLDALEAGIAAGVPRFSVAPPHDRMASPRPVPVALADESELATWVAPKVARRMSRPSKLALAAATMASRQAGFTREDFDREVVATLVATAFGTSAFAEELVRAILVDPQTASPFHFSESVANAPAAQVAIQLGARGSNVAITQRECGGWLALGAAARELEAGRAELALAGAVDEINPLVAVVLARFGATATVAELERAASGHDGRRSGFLPAEGAVVAMLETASHAQLRGATALAVLTASGRGFDPTATPSGFGLGAVGLADGIRRSLDRAGLAPADLGAWIAAASGSPSADALEAKILAELFPARPPMIVAPKAIVGEYGGLALGAAILAARNRTDRRPVLSLSLAAGGAAAWVVLAPP